MHVHNIWISMFIIFCLYSSLIDFRIISGQLGDKLYHVWSSLYSLLFYCFFQAIDKDNDTLYLCRRLGNRHYYANECSPCVFLLPTLGRASFWRLIVIDRLRALKLWLFTYNWNWRKLTSSNCLSPVIKQKLQAWLLHFCVPYCLASGYLVSIHVSYNL